MLLVRQSQTWLIPFLIPELSECAEFPWIAGDEILVYTDKPRLFPFAINALRDCDVSPDVSQ
jgi:hypothetical protein